jgi:hypothetical protein
MFPEKQLIADAVQIAVAVKIDDDHSLESELESESELGSEPVLAPEAQYYINNSEEEKNLAELWQEISTITDNFKKLEVTRFAEHFEKKENKPGFIPISIPLCLRVDAYERICEEIQQLVRERYCNSGDYLYNSIDKAMEHFRFELNLVHEYNQGFVDLNWSIQLMNVKCEK